MKLLIIAIAILLEGCEHPETRRWKGDAEIDLIPNPTSQSAIDWSKPTARVSSYPTVTPPDSTLGVKDLSDRAQETYLDHLLAKDAKQDDIRAAVVKPLKDPDTPSVKALGKLNRTLQIDVTQGFDTPEGDRLSKVLVTVRPKNFFFSGFAITPADIQTLNIVSLQNQTSSSLQAAVPIGGPSLTATAGQQQTNTAAITAGRVNLLPYIAPDELTLYREIDRDTGAYMNTIIPLTIQTDADLWSTHERYAESASKVVTQNDGKLLKPSDATLEVTTEKSPPHCDLIADVYMQYFMRRITSHRESFVEGEQGVRLEEGKWASSPDHPQVIVTADELRPPTWDIYPKGDRLPLHALPLTGNNLPLEFGDYQQARSFAAWLTLNSGAFKSQKTMPVGKTGVVLLSADVDSPFPSGPFEARLRPADKSSDCAHMARQNPPPARPE